MPSALAVFSVRVKPRATKDRVVGLLADGTVKIELAAPPVNGKANHALILFFAQVFRLPKSAIVIGSGHSARVKTVKVLGITQTVADSRLRAFKPS